jgi:serine protein kinase
VTSILNNFKTDFQKDKIEYFSIDDYLFLCKKDKATYSTAQERILRAIGEPNLVDTSKDARLSRIFLNRTIKQYPAFSDFYGIEDVIERIVGFLRYAAQGLEEKKQILYLLGPVGSSKSSLAERLKELMEKFPIYVLCYENEMSPVFESPIGLFPASKYAKVMQDDYGISSRYLQQILSPWAIKRLEQSNGDLSKFRVAKVFPSRLKQIAIMKTEPGDENNQDISTLVGKTNIRMLEKYNQNDPDAYSFSGGLNRANQGLLEFVEMFKAPIKVLHPLLTATQEGNYIGTEAISAIPFNGIVIAHSNESEWQTFKSNKNNEAFIDRICVVKVPYCLRVTEEQKIYTKMLNNSDLASAPCAPATLEMLARFTILTRMHEHENSNHWSKMEVYDGKNIKEEDPNAKSMQEYRDAAGVDEGMSGISTRFAFKVLSATYNADPNEVSADPVYLMHHLEKAIEREQFLENQEQKLISFIKDELSTDYLKFIKNEIQKSYLEAYDEYGQTLFDRYITLADSWIQDIDYKDPETNQMYEREHLNNELEKIEKSSGIANPKDFRSETVNFVLRQKAAGKEVRWTSYEKIRKVIDDKMFASLDDLLPIISFGSKSSSEDQRKHDDFVERMGKKGYTPKQVKRLVEWYLRMSTSS